MTIGTGHQPAIKAVQKRQTQHMFPTSSRLFQHFKENRCKYDGFHIGLCFCIAAGNCVFIVHTPHQSPLCSTIMILVFITVQLSHSLGAQLSSCNSLTFLLTIRKQILALRQELILVLQFIGQYSSCLYSSTDILDTLQININPVSAPRSLHSKYKVAQEQKRKQKMAGRQTGSKSSTCRATLASVL